MTTAAFTETDIAQALAREDGFFMTSHLYWDCQCNSNYIHPHSHLRCHACNALRDESPDARINEIESAGIHHPWAKPPFLATLLGHPGPPPSPTGQTRRVPADVL